MCVPLVTDYVKKNSRGKATAFQSLGLILGDLLTFAVILSITKHLDIKVSFMVAACFVVAFSISFLFIVKEPNMKRIHEASS